MSSVRFIAYCGLIQKRWEPSVSAHMNESTKVKSLEASHKKPPTEHQVSNDEPGVYKTMKWLLAEEFQKVVSVTEGGETKSMTKAAVIAAQLVNKAMAGDKTLLLLLANIAINLPEPPAPEGFRYTQEQLETVEAFRSLPLERDKYEHQR
jgi:hypothetical protein